MTKSYPSKPCTEKYKCESLSLIPFSTIKMLSDMAGVQFEIVFKPEGIRVTLIKKTGKTVRKRTEEVDNADIDATFWPKFSSALADITGDPYLLYKI